MKCPHDDTTLVMSDRNGIEIDYCPQCRGRSGGVDAPLVVEAPQAA